MADLVLINSPMQDYGLETIKPEYSTTAPLGLGYLATIAAESGLEVILLDAEYEKIGVEETISVVNEFSPENVGINSFSTNPDISMKILSKIEAPFKMIGGPFATLSGDEINNDFTVIRGEADQIIMDVLKRKEKGVIEGFKTINMDSLPLINRDFFRNDPL